MSTQWIEKISEGEYNVFYNIHKGKSVHEGIIIHESKNVHESKKMFMKKKLLKNAHKFKMLIKQIF